MDLWRLQVFCKVVELCGFSKAAEAVHLSQPTVSSHISALESHYGCRLIDRLGRAAVPTKAGELLYAHAVRMLALRDETQTALARFQGHLRGQLAIGGSTIPGEYLLPGLMGPFRQQYPDIAVQLIIADSAHIAAQIGDGTIEIGVIGAKLALRDVAQQRLLDDEMALIVPGDHPLARQRRITPAQLQTEPYLSRESGSGTLHSIARSLAKKGLSFNDLKIASVMGSTTAICQGIKHGAGVSILSKIAVADDIATGRMAALAIAGIDLKRHFYLARHRQRTLSPLALAFWDFILGRFQKSPPGQKSAPAIANSTRHA